MATKPSTFAGVTRVKEERKSFGQSSTSDRKKAAPDAATTLTFRILEHGCGKVAAFDCGEGFGQPIHPGHWDFQPCLVGRLQRSKNHVVVVVRDV